MNAAVELLVDDEMAEPARADDADPRVAGIALDRLADRLAELVAAPRRRLVRREVGVDEDRHDRQRRVLHEPLADKGEGVALALALGQGVRGDQVELAVDQRGDQVQRQAALDRVVARLLLLVIARGRPPRPVGARKAVERHVADRLAVIDDEARHVVVVIELLLVVADDDQRVELGAPHRIAQMGRPPPAPRRDAPRTAPASARPRHAAPPGAAAPRRSSAGPPCRESRAPRRGR